MTIPLNTIIHGDGLEVLKGIPADSFDSCVTDPPYGLGFMGKAWDKSGIANNVDLWREVLRVLKPGAHLLSFGGSRTYHRMACAIEDAGFEIRDQIMWIYGSGFPKSHDIGKAIDKQAGAVREVVGNTIYANGKAHAPSGIHYSEKKPELQSGADRVITAPATPEARKWDGWGTALKPAHEPICVARKPFKGTVAENVLQHGTGAINVDGCRIETQQSRPLIISKNGDSKACFGQGLNNSWQDPAGTILGRFPANVIHDGSEEVVGMFPESPGAIADVPLNSRKTKDVYGKYDHNSGMPARGDNGSAARFFYCAKASRDERGPGNNHPTVKPLALIQYLVKLVTPPGGIVLDPFCGSGTLGIAAGKLGMKWQGIELNPKYIEIAERRIEREVGLLLDMEAAHAD
jgi:site-specific DNA-methyltransferase (adenine-specific)